jgi:predicted PhzF superfamily epimerase YddE/YHI9
VLRQFRQVDVFTATPYLGNPVAVVIGADGLSDEQLQRFAKWTNLSETTFVLPPADAAADYRVRIFTPVQELPFAGHPTLGTCHAWLAFAAPPLVRSGPVDEPLAAHVAEVLRVDRSEIVDIQWADNGPGWIAVLLESAEAVLAVRPGYVDLDVGVAGPYPAGSLEAFEVRAFFPKDGVTTEDPVTGSLNASLAQWLLSTERATAPYIASQGTVLGRQGRVHVSQDADGQVWVGGGTVTCVTGSVEL